MKHEWEAIDKLLREHRSFMYNEYGTVGSAFKSTVLLRDEIKVLFLFGEKG